MQSKQKKFFVMGVAVTWLLISCTQQASNWTVHTTPATNQETKNEEVTNAPTKASPIVKEVTNAPVTPTPVVKQEQLVSPLATNQDPRDDGSPWGMGSSGEWEGAYPKFNPLLEQAGVRWVRLWNEWGGIEPKQGQFNWDSTDKIVADAKANHLHVLPIWCYFAPWASADGGTRKGPIKDMQFWRDYVSASVTRYHADIKYWEVWNEFNGSFYKGINKPKEYADLVVAAYDTAKKIDPTAKIGMSVANFDVAFLDAAIKAGAADHFDFICVHPYENLGAVAGDGEMGYLSMAASLRKMLDDNKQKKDIPLWITEMGYSAPVNAEPKADDKQASTLVKGHLLAIAQGFQRIFWFEARGPSYGHGTDLGIIRADWSLRPAYDALKTMTTLLGPETKYEGWLDMGKGGYGFLFNNGAGGNVLAAWSPPGKEYKTTFTSEVHITDVTGKESPLAAGQELTLNNTPVFITHLPVDQIQLAQNNLGKPYPWGGDYAHASVVTCRLGAVNMEDGLKLTNLSTTTVENGLTETWRRSKCSSGGEGFYIYFRADPQFAPFGTKNLKITVVVKRITPDKPAHMQLCYESLKGYRSAPGGAKEIPADDKWHELTWTVNDANFVGQWGWNFRTDAGGSPNEFYIKEVRIEKID